MAKWTIVYSSGLISKDNVPFHDLDLSWLPDDVLAVQSADGSVCTIEIGDRVTEERTRGNDENVDTSTLNWWGNVNATWQAAYDAAEAAAAQAAAEETAAEQPDGGV